MITKKEWDEFRNTGLLLIVNQILHIFGWALVAEFRDGNVVNVYPARVKFRGFDDQSVEENYRKVSRYMLDVAEELNDEANN